MSEDLVKSDTPIDTAGSTILSRFARHFARSPTSFDVELPDQSVQRFGRGAPSFRVTLKNHRALRALSSLDEGRFGDAYLSGDIDIDGDILPLFALRKDLKDLGKCTRTGERSLRIMTSTPNSS